MSDEKEFDGRGCALTQIALLAAILGWPWNAFVLMKLWAWYIVPVFEAEPLSLLAAFGVELVVAQVVPQPYPPEDDDKVKLVGRVIARQWVLPAIILAVGWLAISLWGQP